MAFTTPRGFFPSCEHINEIADQDETLLSALIDVVAKSLATSATASTPHLPQIIQTSTSTFSTETLEATLNALVHILNHVKTNSFSNDQFQTFLSSKTTLTPLTITKMTTLYSNSSDFNKSAPLDSEPIAIQWKIGLIVSSSNCQHIFSPYVTLSLDVDNSQQSFELSVPEFHQFAQTISEIKQTFDDL